MLNYLLVTDYISSVTHKINSKYFLKIYYLLKIRYLNNCVKKNSAPLIHF